MTVVATHQHHRRHASEDTLASGAAFADDAEARQLFAWTRGLDPSELGDAEKDHLEWHPVASSPEHRGATVALSPDELARDLSR